MMSNVSGDWWDKMLDRFFGPPAPPTKKDHVLRDYFYGPRPCPVCTLTGGFHDRDAHAEHEVPRDLLKKTGWQKENDDGSARM
jgi:hypothetical protein